MAIPNCSPEQEMIGRVFTRWTVLAFAGYALAGRGPKRMRRWLCRCVCGTERAVTANGLRTGHSRGCGCVNPSRKQITHGFSGTPEYDAWRKAKDRCSNKGHRKYADYGGRGITMCDRWRDSFKNFFTDMGARPTPNHTLDRANNDGNYEPGNCRWALPTRQARNKRNSVMITALGKTRCIVDWAEDLGLSAQALKKRLQHGWSPEATVTTPAMVQYRRSR